METTGDTGTDQKASWEFLCVALAMAAAAILGFSNLSEPSLWHDELVHVFVGQSIADGLSPQLPGGEPYYNGTTWNAVLGFVIRFFGASEFSVRAPSVLFAVLNIALTYAVIRPLLGAGPAIVAAFALALSPWSVAWSREARFYSLQQSFYLITILGFWHAVNAERARTIALWAAVSIGAYALAVLTSFHSVLFLSGLGLFAAAMFVLDPPARKRWAWTAVIIVVLGVLTVGSYSVLMNSLDREAVFDRGGLGGDIVDSERALRSYYLHWLWTNHSRGLFALAMVGFGAMVVGGPDFFANVRRGRRTHTQDDGGGWVSRRGLFAALAFWAPIFMLTYFIGYRRFRFMFFTFPFFVAAYSYGLFILVSWFRRLPKTSMAWIPRVAIVLLLARIGLSAALLVGDSLETAGGAETTLARRHPQWREACRYVREQGDDFAILTTTYLPVLYYVGRVDDWYPNRFVWWEEDESGMAGIGDVGELQAFMASHPKGYYLAEGWRFDYGPLLDRYPGWAKEAAWVKATMRRVDEASTDDISVYVWGLPVGGAN